MYLRVNPDRRDVALVYDLVVPAYGEAPPARLYLQIGLAVNRVVTGGCAKGDKLK